MITLPQELLKLQQGNDLRPLKPFVLLYRNKWNEQTNKYVVEDTPIDVTLMVVKPNTLSMTLDVNEVAQYNANNVTLTLTDKHNRFLEGTPQSYFPNGYQLYGSRMVLYYGINESNRTALFTGVIKDLPTYKPDLYQVDIKLVSPLELLKDMEAKNFSDAITGENLIFDHTNGEGVPVYRTRHTGVGGFNAVYADGIKLFEGVDFQTENTNELGVPALVSIINTTYKSSTITADYYCWKNDLAVEDIIAGLVSLAGYDSSTSDIRNVVWNSSIRTQSTPTLLFSLGYTKDGNRFNYSGAGAYCYGTNLPPIGSGTFRVLSYRNIFPENFLFELAVASTEYSQTAIYLGEMVENPDFYNIKTLRNGFSLTSSYNGAVQCACVKNGESIASFTMVVGSDKILNIRKEGKIFTFSGNSPYYPDFTYSVELDIDFNSIGDNFHLSNRNYSYGYPALYSQKLTDLDSGISLSNYGIAFKVSQGTITTWTDVSSQKLNTSAPTIVHYRTSDDEINFSTWKTTDLGNSLGVTSKILQFTMEMTNHSVSTDFLNTLVYYLGNTLSLAFVNLSDKTLLEALQDFALITGYEFGIDRNGSFFFRPRQQSTLPVYNLDLKEIVKVDSIKKELTNFFTKLTLTFAQKPLEFYANFGEHPTLIDKYGVINKEIDKPEIINYDNPELAQAIGPQLLETYSSLHNQLQVTAKLNLAVELGDVVNLKRSYPEVIETSASEIKKYGCQQTYYRACKIVGINYNFAKKQMSYTLQDVSDENNRPPIEFYEFVYTLPIRLGAK